MVAMAHMIYRRHRGWLLAAILAAVTSAAGLAYLMSSSSRPLPSDGSTWYQRTRGSFEDVFPALHDLLFRPSPMLLPDPKYLDRRYMNPPPNQFQVDQDHR